MRYESTVVWNDSDQPVMIGVKGRWGIYTRPGKGICAVAFPYEAMMLKMEVDYWRKIYGINEERQDDTRGTASNRG